MKDKDLIIFDIDGTVTPSKSAMTPGMAKALTELLKEKKVALIGGGFYKQLEKQLLKKLKAPKKSLENLFLFPANSTIFYRFKKSKWQKIYSRDLKKEEKEKVSQAFRAVFEKHGYKKPAKTYGKIIEDRGSQITFSALGQEAPISSKKYWNINKDVRPELVKSLKKTLPDFEISRGGLTSIDVTKKGIDKAYGIRQIRKTLNIPIKKMVFIGDALYPGGNDYAAKKTGIRCIKVSGPEETLKIIKKLIKR